MKKNLISLLILFSFSSYASMENMERLDKELLSSLKGKKIEKIVKSPSFKKNSVKLLKRLGYVGLGVQVIDIICTASSCKVIFKSFKKGLKTVKRNWNDFWYNLNFESYYLLRLPKNNAVCSFLDVLNQTRKRKLGTGPFDIRTGSDVFDLNIKRCSTTEIVATHFAWKYGLYLYDLKFLGKEKEDLSDFWSRKQLNLLD